MTQASPPKKSTLLIALWAVILLEIVSPIPAVLSLGAIYVVLVRPAWFPALVDTLYVDPPGRKR